MQSSRNSRNDQQQHNQQADDDEPLSFRLIMDLQSVGINVG